MQVSKILIIVFHELCFALLIILPMDFTERVNASHLLYGVTHSLMINLLMLIRTILNKQIYLTRQGFC